MSDNDSIWNILSSIATILAVFVALGTAVYSNLKDINYRKKEEKKNKLIKKELALNFLIGIKIEMEVLYKKYKKYFLPAIEESKHSNHIDISMVRPNSNNFIFFDRNIHNINVVEDEVLMTKIFEAYNRAKAIIDVLYEYGNLCEKQLSEKTHLGKMNYNQNIIENVQLIQYQSDELIEILDDYILSIDNKIIEVKNEIIILQN